MGDQSVVVGQIDIMVSVKICSGAEVGSPASDGIEETGQHVVIEQVNDPFSGKRAA